MRYLNRSKEVVIFWHTYTPVGTIYRHVQAIKGMRERAEELLGQVEIYRGKQGIFDVFMARLTNTPTILDDFLIVTEEIVNKQLQVLHDL